jgi:hypothetical protein
MTSRQPDDLVPEAGDRPADPVRRDFLGRGAAMAAVAVGAPALLAACDAGPQTPPTHPAA